jgi:hypothetical protein
MNNFDPQAGSYNPKNALWLSNHTSNTTKGEPHP